VVKNKDTGRVKEKFAVASEVYINEALCKGCDICIEFCPKDVFEVSSEVGPRGYFVPVVAKPEDCSACMLCEHLCPELALTVVAQKKPDKAGKKA
jgi:2-oxoglutarate ferredoxin oxidoreductase subunit delta